MSTQISTPIPFIEFISVSTETKLALPVVSENISSGFSSPAMDFIDLTIDLNKHVIKNRDATFFGQVKGKSMKDKGIADDDLLVIDKSIKPANDHIAVFINDKLISGNPITNTDHYEIITNFETMLNTINQTA
jgi:SOS-response transcriptional repressor LexA